MDARQVAVRVAASGRGWWSVRRLLTVLAGAGVFTLGVSVWLYWRIGAQPDVELLTGVALVGLLVSAAVSDK